MIRSCTFLSLFNLLCNAYVIDYSLTKMLTINDTDSYFGYSILLQRGNPPIAIIGAPKQNRNQFSGAVYRCDLNNGFCQQFHNIQRQGVVYVAEKNGAYLGSVLDGDDVAGSKFFTCAPRFISAFNRDNNFYINGKCYYVRNSNNINEVADSILPLSTEDQIHLESPAYYEAAFGECGFSLQYLKDRDELVMGAPGKDQWNGVLVTSSSPFELHYNYASRSDDFLDSANFYGYSVSWGRFVRGSKNIWYVLGGPRAKNLKGNVKLMAPDRNKPQTKVEFSGDFGSYFGASLLVIRKLNGGDDILVGAPTYPGKTWDEGCVYYFRNKGYGTFHPPEKLLGKSPHGRFGTVMADVGDIDLDGFPDFAISAPYEDDGIGAVYLYYGTDTGFGSNNYHRISPLKFAVMFPKTIIKGFGLGVSKGNDVDGNGHNEIVIGAYKSGLAFYFGTYSIIDLKGNITSSVQTLDTTSTNFSLSYCLFYTLRNKKKSSDSFVTQLLLFDERVLSSKNITETRILSSDKLICKSHIVQLNENIPKAEPLDVIYIYKKANSRDFYETNLKIPVSSGCGEDNICQTDFRINATSAETNLIIGLTNGLNINVTISNLGEPAYQTKLYLTVPPEVTLIKLGECYFENGSYVCVVAQILHKIGVVTKDFSLDLSNLNPNTRSLSIDFRVDSSGQNIDTVKNKARINIPVQLQSNPFIDSQSYPESAGASKIKQIIEIKHFFLVGNQGPSPLNLALVILVPQIRGSSVLQIRSAEGINNDITNECVLSNSTRFKSLAGFDVAPLINNNSVLVSCFEPQIDCIEVMCEVGFFPKSSETAEFSLDLLVYTEALVKFAGDKTNAIVVSNAYLNNGTNDFFATSYTVVYGLTDGLHLPLWVYIVSAVSGIILLLLLILCLYKCNFFKRGYKEKLECEQGIMEESSNEKMEENHDDAELKDPMEA